MKNITVIGAGTMGNGIAHVFAMNGFHVNLVDMNPTSLEKALATITKNLDRMVAKGGIDEAKWKEISAKLKQIKLTSILNLIKNIGDSITAS